MEVSIPRPTRNLNNKGVPQKFRTITELPTCNFAVSIFCSIKSGCGPCKYSHPPVLIGTSFLSFECIS